jgi:hypothetical protein
MSRGIPPSSRNPTGSLRNDLRTQMEVDVRFLSSSVPGTSSGRPIGTATRLATAAGVSATM